MVMILFSIPIKQTPRSFISFMKRHQKFSVHAVDKSNCIRKLFCQIFGRDNNNKDFSCFTQFVQKYYRQCF